MENKNNQMVKIQLISRSTKKISILLFVEEGKDNCLSRKKKRKNILLQFNYLLLDLQNGQ